MLLAGQCAGLVISPANAVYTGSELAHQVKDSGSQAVLCHPTLLPVVLEATAHWGKEMQKKRSVMACKRSEMESDNGHKCLDDFIGSEKLEPHVYKDPKEDLAYLCYSSGTTGLAKGVMTTVYNMTRSAKLPILRLPHQSNSWTFSVLSGLYCFMGEANDIGFAFLPMSVRLRSSHSVLQLTNTTIAYLRSDEAGPSANPRRADNRGRAALGD